MKVNSAAAVKPKKKLGKNRKKGWRKNVDVDDVEEFIDDVRLQHRTGGLVAEKADDELFYVEKTESQLPLGSVKSKKKSKKEDLKCYKPLVNTSKIEPPIKANIVKPPSKRLKNKKAAVVSTVGQIKKANAPQAYDLWRDTKDKVEDVDEEIVLHYTRSTNQEPVNVPSHRYQNPSLLDAIEVPHEGASYNPSYDSHQSLLLKAHDEEMVKMKEEERLKRALDRKFPFAKDAPSQDTWLQEMSQGLVDDDESSESDDSEVEVNPVRKNPPVRGDERKLKSKRNKEQKSKLKANQKEKKKKNDKSANEIHRLKALKKEIKEAEIRSNMIAKHRMNKQADKMYKPSRKGKYRYVKPDLEINLTEELSGSFRQMKPEGNLLEDRFKSFQKRNILPTTIKQKLKRKYKLKRYTKRGHQIV